ncbi:MAG: two-component system response regulator [Flavobacteriaceae bacterium]|nr:two-component system response regulator [Flavobacteriaceae bacterium]|tara:strand:- start:640 stop:2187 length:1548 start_codon:yes stop_codon:yes gene_type:complete
MNIYKVLWVDDEIDYLKPHIMFLKDKGYDLTTSTNGQDALELAKNNRFDVILLDENMPGLNGLETLGELKKINTSTPVIMITKNEAEHIMDDAIGRKISDYLIKPVNPNQILLSLKRILTTKTLVEEKTIESYQKEFGKLSDLLLNLKSADDWIDYYNKMIYWELELDSLNDQMMFEIYQNQIKEANLLFSSFIENNYSNWIKSSDTPTLSNNLFKRKIIPFINENKNSILLIIDNLRLDQWKTITPLIQDYFDIISDESYFSILPTATQYSRNSIFSGMTPSQMQSEHPNLWKNDDEKGGKNIYEYDFLKSQLKRLNSSISSNYHKITSIESGKNLIKNLNNFKSNDLLVVVYNFVDMISHSKTEMEIIKELAPDNKGYRSLILSWFKNSPLFELIQIAAKLDFNLIITTDHGTTNVKKPTIIQGKKETSTNLRYKFGRSMTYEKDKVVEVKNPMEYGLPNTHLDSSFIFAKSDHYFIFSNNYNHYANLYNNSFQHGGVSLEEMIIPFATLTPR